MQFNNDQIYENYFSMFSIFKDKSRCSFTDPPQGKIQIVTAAQADVKITKYCNCKFNRFWSDNILRCHLRLFRLGIL